jgi:hypothetical protein
MEADTVIGQRNFDSVGGAASQNSTSSLQGVTSDGENLYVADYSNNRVLIFNHPEGNYPAADVVIGQSSFTANGAVTAVNRMRGPTYALRIGQKLVVSEYNSNRVIIFNTIPTTNGASADVVIGQPDFTTFAPGTTSRKMTQAQSLATDGRRLFVAEYGNNRVLIYNTIPTSSNTPADIVLGQPDFTTNTPGTTPSKMRGPVQVYTDGQKLLVAEYDNHRVLIWDSIPTENFAPADHVLGQPNFYSNSSGTSELKMLNPSSLAIVADKLLVLETNNHRILGWNKVPDSNFVPADFVIGQPNFNSRAAQTNRGGFNLPTFLFFDGRKLYASEFNNARVLVFNVASSSNIPLGPQFEQGKAVLGKVFEDKNSNGRQDKNEKGIEGVKIASDTGIYAITDEDGKYHFPFIQVGQRVLKIDESTLPDGAMIISESPRKVVVTKGILTKVSFGVQIPESETLDSRFRGNDNSVSSSGLTGGSRPLLKVSLSQDPAALTPRLRVSARQEDDKVIFTIDCNYFLFVERAELKIFNADHKLFKTIELGKPIPYEYEMPAAEFISEKNAEPQTFYYQLSVFNSQGREDRTNLGETVIA